jgi:hypothetical protein
MLHKSCRSSVRTHVLRPDIQRCAHMCVYGFKTTRSRELRISRERVVLKPYGDVGCAQFCRTGLVAKRWSTSLRHLSANMSTFVSSARSKRRGRVIVGRRLRVLLYVRRVTTNQTLPSRGHPTNFSAPAAHRSTNGVGGRVLMSAGAAQDTRNATRGVRPKQKQNDAK